jgi:hypothetical protein
MMNAYYLAAWRVTISSTDKGLWDQNLGLLVVYACRQAIAIAVSVSSRPLRRHP